MREVEGPPDRTSGRACVNAIVSRTGRHGPGRLGLALAACPIKRNLMKQPMPLSHLAAARATSSTSLRFAPRNNFITLQISRRSPFDKLPHHSCGCVILVLIVSFQHFPFLVVTVYFSPPTLPTPEGQLRAYTQRFLEELIHNPAP